MITRFTAISLVLATAAWGCNDTAGSSQCGAPNPLCAPSDDESQTPCGDDEPACQRVEIEHCGEPWVRYCRALPGTDSGIDADRTDTRDPDIGGDAGLDAETDTDDALPLCTTADGPCDVPSSDEGCPTAMPAADAPCDATGIECAYCPDGVFGTRFAEIRSCRDGRWIASRTACSG